MSNLITALGGKIDAFSPTPKSAQAVRFCGELFSREGLETAWLLLAEHNGNRLLALTALRDQGWGIAQAVEFLNAAESWTGNVVSSITS